MLAPVVRGRKGEHKKLVDQLRRDGYVRIRVDGELREVDSRPSDAIAIAMTCDPPLPIYVAEDVLNALAYRVRPYEVKRGATNRAVFEAKKIIYRALYEKKNIFAALLKTAFPTASGREGKDARSDR